MDQLQAVRDIQLGASLRDVGMNYRRELIEAFQFRPEEVTRTTCMPETVIFMKKLCRHLGDRHADEPQVMQALRDWVMQVDDYEAYDALLANGCDFDGRDNVVQRGRMLFPGTMTAHWTPEP